MPNKLFKKGLIIGIIILFVGIGIQPAISNEVTIPTISDNKETKEVMNIKPSGISAFYYFIYGSIENLDEDWDAIRFNAVNLRIITILPFRFFHLNPGKQVAIGCEDNQPNNFVYWGTITNNSICGIFNNVHW